ncbi:MAG: ABC transporter substrate-binding protein [Syntrophomonadaceae bacterium]|nr:ABC transporter substrate-binding protein [Syntrophomonadaceae bacterium]
MQLRPRRLGLLSAVLAILILSGVFIYHHRLAVYTASLSSRPFNIGLVGNIVALEPGEVGNHEEILLASAAYEGLVRYDEKSGKIKPLLARKWKYSKDKKTLTLVLDTGIRFSNGKKLSAADVKASWEANFAQGKDWSSLANLFLPVRGGFERIEGHTQDISGIQIIDNHTIKISFEQPNTTFLYMLTNPVFWVYDTAADPAKGAVPGTGPFMIKENKDNKQIIMVPNATYHGEKPRLYALSARIYDDADTALADYRQGKLDYLDQIPEGEIKAIRQDPVLKKRFIYKPLLYTYNLGFNISRAPYDNNYSLRRALNYAIDRKAITEKLLGGSYRPLKGVLPAGINGFDSNMRGYSLDLEKARQLMEEAGYPEGKGLGPLVIAYDNNPGNQAVMEALSDQLGQIGVRIQLQPMDWDYYRKQVGRMEMSCFRIGWQADYPDADSFLYNMYHSERIGISNYHSYNNPQLDSVLSAIRRKDTDSEERIQLLRRAENILVDDAPALFLFQKMAAKLVGEGVNNLNVDSMEMIDWTRIELFKPAQQTMENTKTASNK